MHPVFQRGLYGLLAVLFTFHIACKSTNPTQSANDQAPTKTTLAELKIANTDMAGWADSASNGDTFCIYPGDSLYCCGPGSMDGGAVPYDSIGCKEVAFQTLTGPQQMAYAVHIMDFTTSATSTAMYAYIKNRKSSTLTIAGFDTSTAAGTEAINSISVIAHVNKYYFDLAFIGVTDNAAALDAAAKFLTTYKNRIH